MATPNVTHTFTNGTIASAGQVNENFSDLVDFLDDEVVHRDATRPFTAIPSLPSVDPSDPDQVTRKAYVDAKAKAEAKALGGYSEAVVTLGGSGTQTLDFDQANVWTINPTGTVTFAFANLPSDSSRATSGTIIVQNDTQTLNWPAGTKFNGGEPPTLSGETWLSVVAIGSTVVVGRSFAGVALP